MAGMQHSHIDVDENSSLIRLSFVNTLLEIMENTNKGDGEFVGLTIFDGEHKRYFKIKEMTSLENDKTITGRK